MSQKFFLNLPLYCSRDMLCLSGSGAGYFPLIRITEIRAASAFGGYSTMCRRADERGEEGIVSVLAEIRQHVATERANLSCEPFLTEEICRTHLPRIAEMQVGQLVHL